MLSIIVAKGKNNIIGKENKLLWTLPADMQRFRELTDGHVIIMGRKTFESLGKILPNRLNVIITKNTEYKIDGAYIFNDLKTALTKFKDKKIFICGGEEIYKEALNGKYIINNIYITNVNYDGIADTFFPKLDYSKWKLIDKKEYFADSNNEYDFSINVFKKS